MVCCFHISNVDVCIKNSTITQICFVVSRVNESRCNKNISFYKIKFPNQPCITINSPITSFPSTECVNINSLFTLKRVCIFLYDSNNKLVGCSKKRIAQPLQSCPCSCTTCGDCPMVPSDSCCAPQYPDNFIITATGNHCNNTNVIFSNDTEITFTWTPITNWGACGEVGVFNLIASTDAGECISQIGSLEFPAPNNTITYPIEFLCPGLWNITINLINSVGCTQPNGNFQFTVVDGPCGV